MKKAVSLFFFLLPFFLLQAQVEQKPTGQPGRVSLPTPKIQAITPADLQVTNISLVTAVTNTNTKLVLVKVRVTIRNAGQTPAGTTIMAGSLQSTASGSAWADAGNTAQIQALGANQACTNEVTFKFPMSSVKGKQLNFRVLADAGGRVTEGNENNNYSQGILIGL